MRYRGIRPGWRRPFRGPSPQIAPGAYMDVYRDAENRIVLEPTQPTPRYGAQMTRSTTQTVPNDTLTTIEWDQSAYDTNNFADLTNHRFVMPDPCPITMARFIFSENNYTGQTFNGRREAHIYKGGTLIAKVSWDGWRGDHQVISRLVPVAAGDSFYAKVYHTQGGNVTYGHSNAGSGLYGLYFMMEGWA